MIWLLIIVLSYLIGSIPTGALVAWAKGIDLQQHGSGNIGAANAARVMGKQWGYFVGTCDILKGFLAVKLGLLLAGGSGATWGGALGAVIGILGHNYPVWLRFKGGKGIATSAGTVLALMPPLVVAVVALVWIAVFLIGRFTSLASITAAIALPITILFVVPGAGKDFWLFFGLSILISALAIWRHRANIARLLSGTENRFGKK
jgi:acyl phosphate:glycerol-3-phosphate acyltransferase